MTTNTLTGKEAYDRMMEERERYSIILDYFTENPERLEKRKNYLFVKELSNTENTYIGKRAKGLLEKTGIDPKPSDFIDNIKEHGIQGIVYNSFLAESKLEEYPRAYRAHSTGKGLARNLIDVSDIDFIDGKAGKILSFVTKGVSYALSPLAYVTGVIASTTGEASETIDSLDSRLNSNGDEE